MSLQTNTIELREILQMVQSGNAGGSGSAEVETCTVVVNVTEASGTSNYNINFYCTSYLNGKIFGDNNFITNMGSSLTFNSVVCSTFFFFLVDSFNNPGIKLIHSFSVSTGEQFKEFSTDETGGVYLDVEPGETVTINITLQAEEAEINVEAE